MTITPISPHPDPERKECQECGTTEHLVVDALLLAGKVPGWICEDCSDRIETKVCQICDGKSNLLRIDAHEVPSASPGWICEDCAGTLEEDAGLPPHDEYDPEQRWDRRRP